MPATAAATPRPLARTVDPVGAERFLTDHWERRPLVVPRADPGRFDDLLSTDDVEWLICSARLRTPAFRMVKRGARISPRDYTDDVPWAGGSFTGMADPERVARQFAGGATIVLQALHLHWPGAATYCRGLEAELGVPVQANAYYTPAAAQGFPVHHDTHDVFVLQVAGSKRWLVYEPVLELPLRDQRWSAELGHPGTPIHDLVLQAGDTLYLPRGWPHEAMTSDSESLHLTIGMHAHTWLDAARAALGDCADDLDFRRSIASRDAAAPRDLAARLEARLAPEPAAERARRRFVNGRRAILHGQIGQLRALDGLTVHDALERRPTVIADLLASDAGVTLTFEGKEVRFPARAREAVEFTLGTPTPFTAAQLPGRLDGPGRLVLVRRLVQEGFLRLMDP